MKLSLKEMEFGKLDAKNEYQDEKEFFRKSFLLPGNFPIDDFENGKKYFIYGDKGSGKTALLNYLYDKDPENCSFVLYKTDIDEDAKNDFLLKMDHIDIQKLDDTEIRNLNFENLWQLYFHQIIIENKKDIFKKDSNWKKYEKKVKEIEKHELFTLENINILINASISKGISTGLETVFTHNQKRKAYNKLAVEIKDLFLNLKKKSEKSYFFLIDELELNKMDNKFFVRDVSMVRDLIVAINKMNSMSKKNEYPIKWIAAIRAEVINTVKASGKELNKITGDYGSLLTWGKSGGDYKQHPVLQVLINKIKASEELKNVKSSDDYLNIWNSYFPKYINVNSNSQLAENYILKQTFLRPRDIVRLFNIIKEKHPGSHKFTKQIFEDVRDDYSSQTWSELTEELAIKYSVEELDGIRLALTSQSDLNEKRFIDILSTKSKKHPEVSILNENHKAGSILLDLYKIGVVGNLLKNGKIRFSYRGQETLDLDEKIILHDSIRKTFI